MTTSKNTAAETTNQELPNSVKSYEGRLKDYNEQAKDLQAAYWRTVEARGIARKDLEAQGLHHELGFPFMHISTNLD